MARRSGTNSRLIGVIFLVVGVILIAWGINEAESLSGQISSAISGSPGDRVLWFYIGGGISALIGLFAIFRK